MIRLFFGIKIKNDLEIADKLYHNPIVIPPRKKSKPIQNPTINAIVFQCLEIHEFVIKYHIWF